MIDLWGNEIEEKPLLREIWSEPPFSVLDSRTGDWQKRKAAWRSLGIRSEIGREAVSIHMGADGKNGMSEYTSIFDPHLCEVIYRWFLPEEGGGRVLDPFAGGSVRGIVAGYLGYGYDGIELRREQVESNEEQGRAILGDDGSVRWICGDSDKVLDTLGTEHGYDLVFSCPPYVNLEVYSDLPEDLSTMEYPDFLEKYRSIIKKACGLLRAGGYAVFVVGEVRRKDGGYYGFVSDTVRAFMDAGMTYYNEAVLVTPVASASLRANGNMKTRKIVKTHQNILIFKKI